jgi:tRNA (mo5U34)-methyltransferase
MQDATLLAQDTPTLPLLDARLQQGVEGLVRSLIPWRVGPFQLGELLIDAEWRSYLKWRRIEPLLPALSPTARIADIGCSNGYFLYRLLARDPQLVVGFDPVQRCWLQHVLLQLLLRHARVAFIPAGLTALTAFPRFFDLVVCMGVLYHQRDPFSAVRQLYEATRPGGTVVVESLTVDTPGSFLLVPAQRYAKMRNAWTIPSAEALGALLERAGFTRVTIHRFGPLTVEEQRRTPFAPYESLAEFLDPLDHTRTIEGYPAPHTAAVTGVR